MARPVSPEDTKVPYAYIIFTTFDKTSRTLRMSCDVTFSSLLADAREGLEERANAFLPSQELKDFFVLAASRRSNQSTLARLAQETNTDYKDLIPSHSFILRNITGSSKLVDVVRRTAQHVDTLKNFSILVLSKASVDTEIISELYPNLTSTLRLIKRSEKKWSLKDLQPNLDPSILDEDQEDPGGHDDDSDGETEAGDELGSPGSNVIERLFSRNKQHTINKNLKADVTVAHNLDDGWIHPRHILVQPVYLERIINAVNSFKIVDALDEPDNHSPSYLRNLTSRLDRVYERASYYASKAGDISSSSLTVLVLPIFDDVFVDHLAEYEGAFDLALEKQSPPPRKDKKRTKSKSTRGKSSKKGQTLEHGDTGEEGEGDDDNDGIQEELVTHEEFKTLGDQMYFTFWFSDPAAIDQLWRQNGKPLYYTPRPDRIVLLYGFPFILFEIISDWGKTDEIRAIAQGCSVNRALNIEGITAKGTNDVVTIAVYMDTALVVTFHFLTSKYAARNVTPPYRIPVERKSISFNLAREVERDGNGKVTKVASRCEAVDLVKFLYDIKGFLHKHYPPEYRDRISRVVKEAQDFSLLVRTASDTRSLSKASKQFIQANRPNSKGQSSDSTPHAPVAASGTSQSSRKKSGSNSRSHTGDSGLGMIHEEEGQAERSGGERQRERRRNPM
ncbi:hypothetical protein PQX77_007334 [Marasmius sp. AFHP31]|nr:hypothetical protein PQX77_007334 [Marasmius sp. AFHP31]